MSIFRAFIKEVQRIASVANAGVPHRASDDLRIECNDGKTYVIPKNATILYMISTVHCDNNNEQWINNKKEICLENWLDDNGSFKPNKSELTFGHGYRDCVGKMLAMKELHIVIGYLLLNYKFEFENKNQEVKGIVRGVNTVWPEIGLKVSKYQTIN